MENKSTNIKNCEFCGTTATSLCFECLEYFCESCFKCIHEKQLKSHHKKEPIDPYVPFDLKCPMHPNIPNNLFCLEEKGKNNYINVIYF